MRTMMKEESNNAPSFSVLLDDDSRFSTMLKSFHGHSPFPFSAHLTSVDYLCSIPFSLEDIAKSMPTIETTENDLLPFVRENQSFAFILHRRDWVVPSSQIIHRLCEKGAPLCSVDITRYSCCRLVTHLGIKSNCSWGFLGLSGLNGWLSKLYMFYLQCV